ncbi:hypothetical protein [Arcobacter cloacae]|uniref:GIY-YIG domain-containing protein n=1 Tax=Arcobacter cloacae TaxID=1054034 RepID=A0A4Q0ZCM8_9BACT|nr:hypothetical protein [Arcobacter cloacae]RXJ83430.1 hypothetical protein CRU90_09435 [Arcobacter cloacae]
MKKQRLLDLKRFYSILEKLEKKNISKRLLSNSNGRQKWPEKGVYFFFEPNEKRSNSGDGLRVTRIGTHALIDNSETTLWDRLRQHKGIVKNGGGDHRTSIFRLLVGTALIQKNNLNISTWGVGNTASKDIKKNEHLLEQQVSKIIRNMPFLYLSINDEAGPESLRGYIEKNSISLLSNFNKQALDMASLDWLGHKCDRNKVNESNLWNQEHVEKSYDSNFLDKFEKLVEKMNTIE